MNIRMAYTLEPKNKYFPESPDTVAVPTKEWNKLKQTAAMIDTCFEMNDYPEIEAKPLVKELGEIIKGIGKGEG